MCVLQYKSDKNAKLSSMFELKSIFIFILIIILSILTCCRGIYNAILDMHANDRLRKIHDQSINGIKSYQIS